MTAGQLARAGGFLRAARLIRRGHDDGFIAQSLDEQFPNQPLDVVLQVIALAHQGVEAADRLLALQEGASLPLTALPNITTLP